MFTVIPLHIDLALITIMAHFAGFVACIAGLFYSKFRDNWMQHLGMICVGFASALRIGQIHHRGYASPEAALLAVGIALFAIGVAWKVWQHARYNPPLPDRRKA